MSIPFGIISSATRISSSGGGGTATPLTSFISDYPGAAVAYSLMALSPTYVSTSPVVRVRRSSDSSQQDFTASQVTDGTLTSFCGSGDGFVVVLYDQSGNGRNTYQATLSLQRRVVIAGVLQKEGNNPCWVGISGEFENYALNPSSSNVSVFGVVRPASGENFWTVTAISGNAAVLLVQQNGGGSDGKGLLVGSNLKAYKNGVLQTIVSRTDAYNCFLPNNHYLMSITNIDMSNSAWDNPKTVYGYYTSSVSMAGKIQFFVLYDNDMSSQRTSIEATLNAAFSIY